MGHLGVEFEENSSRELTKLSWSYRSEKLRFRDGLVCTEGLTVEIKLYFQISPAQCGRGPRYLEIFQKYKGKFTRV